MLLSLLLSLSLSADWSSTATALSKSVVYIESAGGTCTGFVINSNAKNDKDLILTAQHCFGEKLFADHSTAKVIWQDSKQDIMVLEIDDTGRPAVKIADKDPIQGQEIVSFGFGLGLEKPMFRHAYVSNASVHLQDVDGGPFVMIDAAYVGGQSGGPCINDKGEVVSIVQRASNVLGIGVGAEKLREKVGRFLEKPKP